MSAPRILSWLLLWACASIASLAHSSTLPAKGEANSPASEATTTKNPPTGYQLTDLTFNALVNGTARWIIDVHSPWCPACQELRPVWERLAQLPDREYEVGEINIMAEKTLMRRFGIRQIPTILLVTPEGDVYEYSGAFSVNTLHQFASKGWTKLRVEEGGEGPTMAGCSSPATRCGRAIGAVMTIPRWIKETFAATRRDFKHGDLALLSAIVGGPVVAGLVFICALDSYVVHKSKRRDRRRRGET